MGDWIAPAFIAAIIAAFVTVAGWFVTHRHERWLETDRRKEKVRDYVTALRAEIRCHNFRWSDAEEDSHIAEIAARLEASDYTPFVPREADNLIFQSIAGEIHILPGETIDPVVRYYRQFNTIAQMIEDIRSPSYAALDAGRKLAIYKDYIGLRREARRLAYDAIEALESWHGAD